MTIACRDARAEDSASLDRIFKSSFGEAFGHLYPPEDLATFLAGFDVARWRAQLADGAFAFRIAESDGEPIGYVKLGPLRLPVEPGGPALALDQLYLLKAHHGAGIASVLLEWAVEEARRRGASELYLTVYPDNLRARGLYDRFGFETVGRYDFMVGRHADEDIVMRKSL